MLIDVWLAVERASAALCGRLGRHREQCAPVTVTIAFGIVHSATFWSMVLLYDLLRRSPTGRRYLIQPELKRPDRGLVRACFANAALNHVVLQWISHVYMIAPLLRAFGALEALAAPISAAPYDVRSVWEHLWRLAACAVVEDTVFYWTHRLLHHKRLYALVHKRHHAFIATHPVGSEHAHLVETLLGNLVPYYLGFVLLAVCGAPAHGTTLMLWTWMRIAESCDGHSGFELPAAAKLVLSPLSLGQERARHDFHHSHGGGPDGVGTTGCYGSLLPMWDWACGTDRSYREWAQRRNAGQDGHAKQGGTGMQHAAAACVVPFSLDSFEVNGQGRFVMDSSKRLTKSASDLLQGRVVLKVTGKNGICDTVLIARYRAIEAELLKELFERLGKCDVAVVFDGDNLEDDFERDGKYSPFSSLIRAFATRGALVLAVKDLDDKGYSKAFVGGWASLSDSIYFVQTGGKGMKEELNDACAHFVVNVYSALPQFQQRDNGTPTTGYLQLQSEVSCAARVEEDFVDWGITYVHKVRTMASCRSRT